MIARFLIARHAQPTKDEQDLTDLGRDQAAATADAHLRECTYFDSLAWSGMARAQRTLVGGLLSRCTRMDGMQEIHELGYKNPFFDPDVPARLKAPTIDADAAKALYDTHGMSAVYRFRLLAFMERTIQEHFLGKHVPAQARDITCLWVSHGGVIESIVNPDISKVPVIGHADILRVEWVVQGLNGQITYRMSTTEILRCPIRTP